MLRGFLKDIQLAISKLIVLSPLYLFEQYSMNYAIQYCVIMLFVIWFYKDAMK